MEVVLEAGLGLLDERLPKAMRRDVVLSMALAYVELSREAMAEVVPAVVRSCDLLETALKVIQVRHSPLYSTSSLSHFRRRVMMPHPPQRNPSPASNVDMGIGSHCRKKAVEVWPPNYKN